ncbi:MULTISPECIES: nucleoid-associated protein [unclassified Flavobacterium]|uniref:nucleoid-associated protein n=1 Tax=unclassified Flavobacterium TaxID=196869 RepID=UPI001F1357E0|nr:MULTISPECIES: nucleoid-associated protein [unclassified Flavobacterium]UMY64677.1 nucleoid-associated protein [Flavobacterium sp. HJ-32-4]
MAKESVLSLAEKQSIVIKEFIFHIIVQEEEEPRYLDAVTISDEQKQFFRDRLIDVSQGNQFIFADKTTGATYKLCQKLLENTSQNFLEVSKSLTADFKSRHSKNTSDGVFITALAEIDGKRNLIFLVKLDHKKVYRYKVKDATALLEEIKNTFIEDKSAVQKVALIDVTDYYIWDVLAYDRAKPGSLTDYFKNFLSVKPRDTPSKWTTDAIQLPNRWASANRDILDPEQQPYHYKERAITYLSTSSMFSTDEYIDFVVIDEDENRREILKESFRSYMIETGLHGQEFPPNKGSINRKTKRNTVKTSEGVTLQWTGSAEDANINIPQKSEDGLYHIAITSHSITYM